MSLKGQITEDMKSAMKAGEKDRLKVVRLILAAIKQVEVDKRIELDDAAVLSVLDKMVKQRRDSVEQFEKGNRQDLADIEKAEIAVLETYLPEHHLTLCTHCGSTEGTLLGQPGLGIDEIDVA